MIVYAIAAGSFKRSSGAPDAAEHCAPAKRAPELMTGNMLGRFRMPGTTGDPDSALSTQAVACPDPVLFEDRSGNKKI
jgi:hypothetical protein